MKNKKTIIVTGLGRCGTSAIAGILNKINIPMSYNPENLTGPDFANPKGQFEDLEFQKTNENILHLADCNKWWYEIPDPEKILAVGKDPDYQVYIKKVIEIRNDKFKIWGVKGPRFTATYPIIRPYLNNPHVIYCGRPADESVQSMVRVFREMKWDLPPEAYAFWATVTARCMNYLFSLSDPLLIITFEEMMTKPEETTKKVCKFINHAYTQEALEWIDPGLRNFGGENNE